MKRISGEGKGEKVRFLRRNQKINIGVAVFCIRRVRNKRRWWMESEEAVRPFFIDFGQRVKRFVIGSQANNTLTQPKSSVSLTISTSIRSIYFLSHHHIISHISQLLFIVYPSASSKLINLFSSPLHLSLPHKQPFITIWFLLSYKIMIPNPQANQNPLTHVNIPHNPHQASLKCCKEHSTTPNSAEDEPTNSRVPYKFTHTSCHISQSSNREEDVSLTLNSLKQQLSNSNQANLLRLSKDIQLLNIAHPTKVSLKLILTHKLADLNPKHQKIFKLALEEYQSFHFSLI